MDSSNWKRKAIQAVCTVGVFFAGTVVVQSQEAERKVLKKVEPDYPAVLRQKGIGGTVKLAVTVRADGTVKDVRPLGGNAVLIESASNAVKQWRYSPSERETTIQVSIHFGAQE
jgi:TonB family protein